VALRSKSRSLVQNRLDSYNEERAPIERQIVKRAYKSIEDLKAAANEKG
jgi:hypothetical protein